MNEIDAKKILKMNEDEILLGLGRILIREKHSKPQEPARYLIESKKWLERNWDSIKEKVCGNEKIKKLINNKNLVDDTSLVITIFSLFSGMLEPAIAALVSGLVVRRGITSICCVT